MKAVAKTVIFSFFYLAFQTKAWPADSIANIDRAQAERDLTLLIQTAQEAWAYAEYKREHFNVNLDILLEEGKTALARCQTRQDVLELLQEMVAELKDGHAVLDYSELDEKQTYAQLPCSLIDTEEGVVFGKDLIVRWNGQSIEEKIQTASRRTCGSTPGMRRMLALRSIEWEPKNDTVRLSLKRLDGQIIETNLIYNANLPKKPNLEFKWITHQIAYLRLNSFKVDTSGIVASLLETKNASGLSVAAMEASKAKISAAFEKAAPAKCLILDLRGNMGGTDTLGSHAALHLIPGSFTYFKLQTRYSSQLRSVPGFEKNPTYGWGLAYPWAPERPSSITAFQGMIIVLQDPLCFSTTDNFLACLRDLLPASRVRFVGRPSGGGTGAPRVLATLPWTGAKLTLTIMKVFSPHERLIEGRGTIPDRLVKWTWRDVLEDRDADLAAALEEAIQTNRAEKSI